MSFKEMDPTEARELIKETGNLQLLDVREQHEFDQAHIEGVSLISLGQLPDRASELDKDRPILCICAGGIRSERAAKWLVENDFVNVTNMTEGMNGWLARNFPANQG